MVVHHFPLLVQSQYKWILNNVIQVFVEVGGIAFVIWIESTSAKAQSWLSNRISLMRGQQTPNGGQNIALRDGLFSGLLDE